MDGADPRQDLRIRLTAIPDIKYYTLVNDISDFEGAEGLEKDWYVW